MLLYFMDNLQLCSPWKSFQFSENRPESSASVISLGSDSAESVHENGKVQEKRDGEEPDEDDLYCDQVRREDS